MAPEPESTWQDSSLPASRAAPAPVIDDPSAPAAPVLFCPHCDYNLTGLPEDRCPECGQSFDRRALTAMMSGPYPPPLTSMRADEGVLKVVSYSLFRPSRIGRELAVRCDPSLMLVYGAATKLCAVVLVLLCIALGTGGHGGGTELIPLPAIVLMAMFTETAIAFLLARLSEPSTPIPRKVRYPFWRNLTRCFGMHLLVSAGMILLGISLPWAVDRQDYTPHAVIGGLALSFLWWWLNLGTAIVVRAKPTTGRFVILLLIPVAGVAAIAGGWIMSVSIAFVAFR